MEMECLSHPCSFFFFVFVPGVGAASWRRDEGERQLHHPPSAIVLSLLYLVYICFWQSNSMAMRVYSVLLPSMIGSELESRDWFNNSPLPTVVPPACWTVVCVLHIYAIIMYALLLYKLYYYDVLILVLCNSLSGSAKDWFISRLLRYATFVKCFGKR